jgi:hypothetical protein
VDLCSGEEKKDQFLPKPNLFQVEIKQHFYKDKN